MFFILILGARNVAGLARVTAEGSKERIGPLAGLSKETYVASSKRSLSSPSTSSVGFEPLEFILISFTGR